MSERTMADALIVSEVSKCKAESSRSVGGECTRPACNRKVR